MNYFGALIIFCFIFIYVNAQEHQYYETEVQALHPFHPSLIATIGVLAVMFLFIILVLCHANHFGPLNLGINHDQIPHGLVRSRSSFSGFDKTIIESLPFFIFSSLKGSKEGLECAVCLSKFEETEFLRLLPKCKHAFHRNCIDMWLERHSSCPLCRHQFDAGDVSSFAFSSSLRFSQNQSNLTNDSNLEISVQRSEDGPKESSRFSSFRGKNDQVDEELPIQEFNNSNVIDGKIMDKIKHKIILSDALIHNRWSDANSSDMLSLNSEMMNFTASRRFPCGHSVNEQMMTIKDFKVSTLSKTNDSVSGSICASKSAFEDKTFRLLGSGEKRSKSEIMNIPRFMEFTTKNDTNDVNKENLKRLWLPIALRTVEWFAGNEYNKHQLNV